MVQHVRTSQAIKFSPEKCVESVVCEETRTKRRFANHSARDHFAYLAYGKCDLCGRTLSLKINIYRDFVNNAIYVLGGKKEQRTWRRHCLYTVDFYFVILVRKQKIKLL